MKTEKQPRGGKREGAGRPKQEPTVQKYIPLSILERVEKMIKRAKAKKK